jgi:Bacterial membrane protein YfhO/6-pyruvoyl-tetrahydropterin synthase related domain
MPKKKKTKKATVPPVGLRSSESYLESLFKSRFYDLYYIIFIFFLTIVLFNEFVFSAKMLFSSDGINASIYFRKLWLEIFPNFTWSQYIFGGMPYVDAFHSDIWYPLTAPLKLLFGDNVPRAFGWNMILHVFLSGVTMYYCARTFKLSKLASSFAGIFFMFAPYLVSMVQPGHDGKMYVTALFPLTMLFLERGMNNGKFLDFTLLGAAIGLLILTPHPQMSYFALWAIGFYFGFRIIMKLIQEKRIQAIFKPSVFFVGAVVLGLLISAIQFYPSFKYVKEFSPRSEEEVMTPEKERERYMYATSWSMNAEELEAQFIPNFCGSNATRIEDGNRSHASQYWGKNAFKDNSEYIGVFPLFLGLIGIIFVRNKRTWFFLGLAGFALVYALGASTPLFKIFYHLIPNVKHLRAPSMIMFIFSFSFCLLAAYGVNYIQTKLIEEKPEKKKQFFIYCAIVSGLYLLGALLMSAAGESVIKTFKSMFNSGVPDDYLLPSAFANIKDISIGLWLLAAFLILSYFLLKMYANKKVGVWVVAIMMFFGIVDAWRMDFKFITTDDPASYFAEKNVVRMIKSADQPYVDRVLNCDRGILRSSNYFAYHGIPMMFGYHGNQMKLYDQFWGRAGKSNDHSLQYQIYLNRNDQNDSNNGTLSWLNVPMMTIAGVKYLVFDYGTKPDGYDQYITKISTYETEKQDGLMLYENRESFGRCKLFHDYVVALDHDHALQMTHVFAEGWKTRVILEADPGIEKNPAADTIGEKAEILSYDPNKIVISTKLNSDGLLYLADCYYPAWKAYVDGEKTEIILANSTFRVVPLKAGEHMVEFKYQSETFKQASLMTGSSMLFVIIVIAFNLYIHFKRRKDTLE